MLELLLTIDAAEWGPWERVESSQTYDSNDRPPISMINVPPNDDRTEYRDPRWQSEGGYYGSWSSWETVYTGDQIAVNSPQDLPPANTIDVPPDTISTQYDSPRWAYVGPPSGLYEATYQRRTRPYITIWRATYERRVFR